MHDTEMALAVADFSASRSKGIAASDLRWSCRRNLVPLSQLGPRPLFLHITSKAI